MKLLFVGEGKHDIGADEGGASPWVAGGVVPALARRVCPQIANNSLALKWRDLPLLNREGKRRGFDRKVVAAVLVSVRRFACAGTVCVADHDGDYSRLREMEAGAERANGLISRSHPVVCGTPIMSVESWTLGARDALAAELNVTPDRVGEHYPDISVEEMKETSGKEDHRPKPLLARLAALGGQVDCTEFRVSVAMRTDPLSLTKQCPRGFKPFSAKLQAAFCPPSSPGM